MEGIIEPTVEGGYSGYSTARQVLVTKVWVGAKEQIPRQVPTLLWWNSRGRVCEVQQVSLFYQYVTNDNAVCKISYSPRYNDHLTRIGTSEIQIACCLSAHVILHCKSSRAISCRCGRHNQNCVSGRSINFFVPNWVFASYSLTVPAIPDRVKGNSGKAGTCLFEIPLSPGQAAIGCNG